MRVGSGEYVVVGVVGLGGTAWWYSDWIGYISSGMGPSCARSGSMESMNVSADMGQGEAAAGRGCSKEKEEGDSERKGTRLRGTGTKTKREYGC